MTNPTITPTTTITATDRAIAEALAGLPGVRAVFLGGSRASGTADDSSDTDLYALCHGFPDAQLSVRALAPLADDGRVTHVTAWGSEDHLRVAGALVEIVHLDAGTLGVDAFYDAGAAPTGYTTAFLHTLALGVPLVDDHGDLAAIQGRLRPYPEPTRRRILAQTPGELAEYVDQVRKAQGRHDWTSVTHRRAVAQTAWFDAAFALNRRFHPGEKRMLTHLASCEVVPVDAEARWTQVALLPADDPRLPGLLGSLASDLVELLTAP